jgi:hypothetical protein
MNTEIPIHLADQLEAACADVAKAFEHAPEAITAAVPTWPQILDGLHYLCIHIATQGPQPIVVRWAKRSALCVPCDDLAAILPDVVPADECERCGAKTTRFHEALYQVGPALFGTNICCPCHDQVAAGEPALLEDRHPRGGGA